MSSKLLILPLFILAYQPTVYAQTAADPQALSNGFNEFRKNTLACIKTGNSPCVESSVDNYVKFWTEDEKFDFKELKDKKDDVTGDTERTISKKYFLSFLNTKKKTAISRTVEKPELLSYKELFERCFTENSHFVYKTHVRIEIGDNYCRFTQKGSKWLLTGFWFSVE